jgi:poly-gamma-glutamate synthesis protein (capsule biosynthesis protein)
VGGYSDRQQAEKEQGYTICDIGGIRVALVGYTKGFDGLSLPPSGQWCTNVLYTDYSSSYQKVAEDAIKATLQSIQAQKPDLTVALVHWGSTYNDIISASQKRIEEIMLENGVDAIIGTHSHYVQQVKYDAAAGTVVAYSLGDLFSAGQQNGSHYSILLQLQVTRDNATGETKITACDYVPIYTLTPERDGEAMRLVRIEAAMEQYENRHINRVNSTAYQNLLDALERIRSRVGF